MTAQYPSIDTWYRGVPRSTRLPTAIGFVVLFFWLFGFGAWAAIAPLASAVVTSGYFVAIGQNKQIQVIRHGPGQNQVGAAQVLPHLPNLWGELQAGDPHDGDLAEPAQSAKHLVPGRCCAISLARPRAIVVLPVPGAPLSRMSP